MRFHSFHLSRPAIWHIYVEGNCRKAAQQDEEVEVQALMDSIPNSSGCGMVCPAAWSDYLEISMEVFGLQTDAVIDSLIKYLIDKYDMYECSIDLSVWENPDCTGWTFSVANYRFRRSENMDTVTRTCISYDEVAYILDDVPSHLWDQVSTEILTLRLQLEEHLWGGRKEISSTKKFRGKPK